MIFDAHLDLSLNALEWNRDLRRTAADIRQNETGKTDLRGRGRGTVAFPDMRCGGVGMCVATQIAGCMKPAGPVASWDSPEQAWAMTRGQLAWYRAMEEEGHLRQIRSASQLKAQLSAWESDPAETPIGYLLSLEGADSLIDLSYLERAYDSGLRAIGLSHYGIGRYALGHDQDGPLSGIGRDLLKEIGRLGMIVDVTHLSERTFWDVVDLHPGPLWASHHNCRALVDDPRQLSDEQIRTLVDRGSVIGVAFDAWMLTPGWVKGESTPTGAGVTLQTVADHIDHVCQLAGNACHVGIGSDLDGGFGGEQSPADLDTIADLPRLGDILAARGCAPGDVERVMHKNFADYALQALPD